MNIIVIANHNGDNTIDQDQFMDPISLRIINTINNGPKKFTLFIFLSFNVYNTNINICTEI